MMLDPTQWMLKNITPNAFNFPLVQDQFAKAAAQINMCYQQFFDELNREMKEQGGVKKDYFLSYSKKKDRVLDMSKNICDEALKLRRSVPANKEPTFASQ